MEHVHQEVVWPKKYLIYHSSDKVFGCVLWTKHTNGICVWEDDVSTSKITAKYHDWLNDITRVYIKDSPWTELHTILHPTLVSKLSKYL